MKWILAILLLVSATVNAQIGLRDDSTKYIHYKYQYGSRMPRFWADSALHIPYYDTAIVKPQKAGAIMMHLDKNVYKWNGGGWEVLGGASITLNNVGTGHRLVATPGGNIKTLVFGYGVNGDSTTNANSITVVADTSELVTPSDLNDAIAGTPTPSWQQTLNVSPNTYGRLVFDTSFTKPTGVENPAEHTWFTMNPLVKEDEVYTSPFYWNQFSGWNNGRMNEVMILGWNASAGGGHMQPGKPALAFSLESNYFTDRGNGLKRFMESHLYYVDSNGLQYRPWSYEINTTDGVNNFYHSVSSFSLRGFGSVSSPANNPYYTIQGTANLTESSFINISNQTEYFGTSANFNQDANTANYTINSGSGKPFNVFNVSNFNESTLPSASLYTPNYDGSQIAFTGATTGQLGRILFDSSQSRIGSFTNVVMKFLPNQTNTLDLFTNKINIWHHTSIGIGNGTPIAELDVRSSTEDQTLYVENTKAGGYGAIITAPNAAGGNVGLDITASGTLPNKGINYNATMGAGDWTHYSGGLAKIYNKGKVGIGDGVTSPDSTLQINGSFHNNAGVRMEGLPTGPGTKAVRIDANGTLSVADTTVGGGITSINGHTGSAITVQGGTALSVDNSTPDVVTFNVTPNSSALPHTLDAVYTTAGNTGTGETDLFTYTLPAGELAIDGRTMNFEIDGEFNDNTITAQLKLYFAGNVTLNTGAVSVSTAFSKWRIKGYIMRTSSSTAHVTYEMHAPGLATPVFLSYNNLTSLDFTTTNVFKISAQAAGGGASNSDITAHSWQLLYKPQPQ